MNIYLISGVVKLARQVAMGPIVLLPIDSFHFNTPGVRRPQKAHVPA